MFSILFTSMPLSYLKRKTWNATMLITQTMKIRFNLIIKTSKW